MRKRTGFSFDNLETAFAHLSIRELEKRRSLLRLMHFPLMMKAGILLTNISFQLGLPIKKPVKRTIFSQFCGGESIEECQKIIKKLRHYGIGSILDYSVEGKAEERVLEATAKEILETIHKAKEDALFPFAVFKISGIASTSIMTKVQAGERLNKAEEKRFNTARKRMLELCACAKKSGVKIMIDGEESWFQDITDHWVLEAMKRYNKEEAVVFNTYQMYRKDMSRKLKDSHHEAVANGFFLGAKLVRGAYMEKERLNAKKNGYPNPIHPKKEATDKAYNEALQFCVNNKQRISLVNGSHNELSNIILAELIDLHRLKRSDDRFYFSQLYGMSDPISFNLAKAGFNVVKYLPYGPVKEVLPYLGRRVKENSGISGQTRGEQKLIKKEISRRKNLNKLPKIA
jgi:proline dehydrogenase